MITMASCSVWSMWEANGTIAEMAPSLATDGEMNVEAKALRVKSPEPPMPFMMREPPTWVELMLP